MAKAQDGQTPDAPPGKHIQIRVDPLLARLINAAAALEGVSQAELIKDFLEPPLRAAFPELVEPVYGGKGSRRPSAGVRLADLDQINKRGGRSKND